MTRILLAALALVCVASNADARVRHHRHHHAAPVSVADPNCNILWPCEGVGPSQRGLAIERQLPFGRAQQVYKSRQSAYVAPDFGLGGGLVSRARAYMGGNPTGWGRAWCGRFMAMIAPDAASRIRNPNMARDWASLPHVAPQVGAIAVLARRGGGHVGVVSGFDAGGNPIIVSGNHGHRVGEGVYPRGRVLAYVSP